MKVFSIGLLVTFTSIVLAIFQKTISQSSDDFPGIDEDYTALAIRISINTFRTKKWNVNVKIYTRKTTQSPIELVVPTTNYSSLYKIKWNKKLVIIIHGYLSYGNAKWVTLLGKSYLKRQDVNVLIVDWSDGALTASYMDALQNAWSTYKTITTFLKELIKQVDLKAEDIHIIGHSLGAHMAGSIGRKIQGIDRITGLDPARPGFLDNPKALNKTNAKNVDIIHTSSMLGLNKSLGHIDIYPNTIDQQPGCFQVEGMPAPIDSFMKHWCSHSRAISYFLESIYHLSCHFTASKNLKRANKILNTEKFDDEQDITLGLDTFSSSARGDFYLRTNEHYPFCKSFK